MASPCFSCQLEALWTFSQSVVLPEEAPRLRAKRDKSHAGAWFCSGHQATRAAGGQPGRAVPGEPSEWDQRTWPCVRRGLCRRAVNRCAGQVLGTQRCRRALPSVGPAAPGVAVPSGRLGAPSVGLWEGGVFSGCLPACLLSGRSHLPRPGLRPSLSHLGIGPSVGSCWTPPPHTVLLLSATPSSSAKPPPPRPLALPGGTDALLLTSTCTLPPPRARSAACLSCTFQQSPGALKRPLRSYPEGGGEGGWGPGRGAGLERPPCCVCAGRGGMRGGS